MNTLTRTAFLVASIYTMPVAAQDHDVSLLAGLESHHWALGEKTCPNQDCNQHNNLVGVQVDKMIVAEYYNSIRHTSVFVGAHTDQKCLNDRVCYDWVYGGVTGYSMKVLPVITTRVLIKVSDHIDVQVFGIPGAIMAAGLKINF